MTRIPEHRLDEIRRQAELAGRVDAPGVRAAGSPLPPSAQSGYYGQPLLKGPVWTWEIPVYFFVGGAAGVAAMIGVASQWTGGSAALTRDARRLAAAGAFVSGPLLVSDLGRPERFLNMLRVFKVQSPMSVGAWLLTAFGASATAALLQARRISGAAAVASALTGLGMATYTGVLLGATAIPIWSRHVSLLPFHFGASSTASAVALLELAGHKEKALNRLGTAAAIAETTMAARTTTNRVAEVLSGPLPLVLRLIGSKRTRRAAAFSSLIGSVLTRFAWVEAGRTSARNEM